VSEKVREKILIKRIGTTPTPIPYAVTLENRVIPDVEKITQGIIEVIRMDAF
jgi:pyruvate/2-oxoglutarate/acetoin dehydrogenase E1 component